MNNTGGGGGGAGGQYWDGGGNGGGGDGVGGQYGGGGGDGGGGDGGGGEFWAHGAHSWSSAVPGAVKTAIARNRFSSNRALKRRILRVVVVNLIAKKMLWRFDFRGLDREGRLWKEMGRTYVRLLDRFCYVIRCMEDVKDLKRPFSLGEWAFLEGKLVRVRIN